MTILLLRHAHAGDRAAATGDDRNRPLSTLGLRQALAVVDQFAERPVDRIVSSPYARCVQSVEPLGAALDLPVETDDALAEGAPLDVVRRLLRRPGGREVVLCSHGDVIGAVVQDLADRALLDGADLTWPKASTWVLDGPLWSATPPDDRDVRVGYLPPPT